MKGIAFEPFSIEMDRIGRFKRNDGDLWWVGVKSSKPLIQLQRGLSDQLRLADFSIEKRKYSPHITLGRQIVTNEKEHLLTRIDGITAN